MKTTIILSAAFALVLAATVAVREPILTRFEVEAPAGNVEVRPISIPQWMTLVTRASEEHRGGPFEPRANPPTVRWPE